MKEKINVAIADDHPMVISGVQKMLAGCSSIILTDCYPNGETLVTGLKKHLPDVLLLDIQMPDITGDKLLPVIVKKYPQVRILILTNFDSIFYLKNMMQHGASGYLLKSTDQQKLIDAIQAVHDGNEYLEPALKQQADEKNSKTNRPSIQQPILSAREKEVIQLIADGFTTAEIAQKIFLSFTTIENYRFNLLSKFGVKNTAMLIKKAVQLGLVQ